MLALRPAHANSVEHDGAPLAARQRAAYPDVKPIVTSLRQHDAFRRALEVAEQLGWAIVAQEETRGIIEAVDTTSLLRFKDDVVVRIQPHEEGSRVDLRSLSRIGRADFGKNARRIMKFTKYFTAETFTKN